MAGLLRRALSIRTRRPELESSDDDHGISSEERAQIAEQIEELLRRSGPSIEGDPTPYTPRKRGFALPVAVNAAAVALIVVAAYAVPHLLIERGDVTAARTDAIEAAEGMVVGAVQEEARARLAERDDEIARIQDELADADRRREELASNIEQELQAREDELRRALETELESERARLSEAGLSAAAIEEQLEEIERERESQLAAELEAEREEAEAELRAREEELEQTLAEAEAEREALLSEIEDDLEDELQETETQFAALQERGREYELASAQIVGSYEDIAGFVRRGEFEAALERLDELADYLGRSAFDAIPRLAERRESELLTVEAMRMLLSEQLAVEEEAAPPERAAVADEEADALAGELREREEEIASLAGELEQMREELAEADARLQELIASRDSLTDSLDRLVSAISPAEDGERRSTEEVVSMLSARLQVRQVLRSESVRAEYPELSERFEHYLDAYSAQETARGRAAALADVAELAEAIRSGDIDADEFDSLWARYTSPEEQEQMLDVFRTMRRLVSE